MALAGIQANSPVGKKGYTGNLAGQSARPENFKGLTPKELKSATRILKRVLPEAALSIVTYMDSCEGIDKAKAAKELITLYITLDKHTLARAAEANKLAKDVVGGSTSAKDVDKDLREEEDVDPSDKPAAVFTMHLVAD